MVLTTGHLTYIGPTVTQLSLTWCLIAMSTLSIAYVDILHVAAVCTERSTCRRYPEWKIDFFLHAHVFEVKARARGTEISK